MVSNPHPAGHPLHEAWAVAAGVLDPEVPVLSIADLGVLREVRRASGAGFEVIVTPTYSGCPAIVAIALEIELAFEKAGIGPVTVTTILSPAWTTDWMSEDGRLKLSRYGIAPPAKKSGRRALFGVEHIACPRCGSQKTIQLSEFGSTACKALWRCEACLEPFDYFKCH